MFDSPPRHMDLIKKHCIPCEGGAPPLTMEQIRKYLAQTPSWDFLEKPHHVIRREFKFKNFVEAMTFVNKIAALAEQEGHHPDINIHYNQVILELWTHAVGGLSENDFILATKINQISGTIL